MKDEKGMEEPMHPSRRTDDSDDKVCETSLEPLSTRIRPNDDDGHRAEAKLPAPADSAAAGAAAADVSTSAKGEGEGEIELKITAAVATEGGGDHGVKTTTTISDTNPKKDDPFKAIAGTEEKFLKSNKFPSNTNSSAIQVIVRQQQKAEVAKMENSNGCLDLLQIIGERAQQQQQQQQQPNGTLLPAAAANSFEGMPMPPPPPPIESPSIRPGAYALAPGENLTRTRSARLSLLGAVSSDYQPGMPTRFSLVGGGVGGGGLGRDLEGEEEDAINNSSGDGRGDNHHHNECNTNSDNEHIAPVRPNTTEAFTDATSDSDHHLLSLEAGQLVQQPQQSGDYNDLPDADPIDQDEILPDAQPVDLDASKQRRQKRRDLETRKLVRYLMIALFLVLAFVGILLGILAAAAATAGNGDDDIDAAASADTSNIAGGPSISSTSSSATPTTQEVLTDLLDQLPDYALENLGNPFSAQAQAFHWLQSHQDIGNMELWRKKQLFALSSFFFGFDGTHWPYNIKGDWLDDSKSECEWFSIRFGTFSDQAFQHNSNNGGGRTCNQEGEFIALDLSGMGRRGGFVPSRAVTMPPEVALLTSLKVVRLNSHDLSSPGTTLLDLIPSQFVQLTNLQYLELKSNRLGESTIPSHLWNMTNLKELSIGNNPLTGTIATELGLMRNLRVLDLHRCSLTGIVPSQIGLLSSNMQMLDLSGSKSLGGAIPSELGLLTGLTTLNLFRTSMDGAIPSELGLLTGLTRLDLSTTSMTGSIPVELFSLTTLVSLDLSKVFLTGPLPTEVGLLDRTKMLSLSFEQNSLKGQIPTELGLLSNLKSLSLANNSMTGPIPTELGLLANLTILSLRDNTLNGTIPTELGKCSSIQRLGLSHNDLLTGSIPLELGNLSSLRELLLDNTTITGSIPKTAFGNLVVNHSLHVLTLASTNLTGTIPNELCILNRESCSYLPTNSFSASVSSSSSSSEDSVDEEDLEACRLAFACSNLLCGCGCDCGV